MKDLWCCGSPMEHVGGYLCKLCGRYVPEEWAEAAYPDEDEAEPLAPKVELLKLVADKNTTLLYDFDVTCCQRIPVPYFVGLGGTIKASTNASDINFFLTQVLSKEWGRPMTVFAFKLTKLYFADDEEKEGQDVKHGHINENTANVKQEAARG